MGDLVLVDAIARGIAMGAFATLGLAIAQSRQSQSSRWIGAIFFVTAIGHTLSNCVRLRMMDALPDAFTWALSAAGTGMFWTFAVTLFDDEPRIRPAHILIPTASLGLATLARLIGYPHNAPVWLTYNVLSVALVAHALSVIWQGWRGDLVERRRRLRAPVMAAAALYVLLTAGNDASAILGHPNPVLPIFQGIFLAVLGVAGGLALLRLDPVMAREPARARPTPDTAALDLAAADAGVLKRLARAMDEDEIWRHEDLSIRSLADHLALPEHRLRRLINGDLGYRNFAAFVNARRIEAAKAALADPAQGRRPISAMAFELGFGSLGPFNRAFRDVTGMSPTEWRAAQGLAET